MSSLLYEALMLGRNKKIANEEYLVASGKKQASSYNIIEENITISDVISDGEFCLHIEQKVPGYSEFTASCDDAFIRIDNQKFTSEDFTDGLYEFHFVVLSDRLHNGRNYTSILLRTSWQCLEIPVIIDNRIRTQISDVNPRERMFMLEKAYLQLQLHKSERKDWEEQSLGLLDDIPGDDEASLGLMLYKSQIYITRQDYVFAKNYIEYVATQIPKLDRKKYDLRCYFIYLASLYEELEGAINSAVFIDHDQEIIDSAAGASAGRLKLNAARGEAELDAVDKVRSYYSKYPDWKILWVLFYMDPELRGNYVRRLVEMRSLFDIGNLKSPVMYLEALKIYRSHPDELKIIGSFELQVLNYASKNDYLTQELADRTAHVIADMDTDELSETDQLMAVRLLQYAYDKYLGGIILTTICLLVINLGIKDKEYHRYFRKAVKTGITEDEIYNYYIYTIDRSGMEPIEEKVLNYFLEHTELLYEYKQYMYANIIKNKALNPDIYRSALDAIVKYAEYQVSLGQNSELLAVIYQDILDNDMLTQNMKNNLFDVICTKEVICYNKMMRSVMVFHNELPVYQESVLRDGRALIKIYSSDALILFKDEYDNIYHHTEYRINQLLDSKKYIDLCIKDVPVNKYMMLGDTLPLLRAYKPPVEILEFFTNHSHKGEYRKSYEQELINNIIAYYAKNSRDEAVYDELLKFTEFELAEKQRGELILIMLKRGQIDNAYYEVKKYGICNLSKQSLALLAHAYINAHGTEKDATLTAVCEAGYDANGFDELVFDYMYRFYNGRMDILIELFRSCNAYKKPADVIEERILKKSIETGEHPEIVAYVFKKFHEEGGDTVLSAKYMHFRALLYLQEIMVRGSLQTSSDMSFFDCMEEDMMNGCAFDDECSIALILYRQNLEAPGDRQIRNIEQLIKDLVRRGKMLEEFKYYGKYFRLPATLTNNIIISAFSENPDDIPVITYEITGPGGTINGSERMEEIFSCCYVKYFNLLYGGKVVFSMDGRDNMQVAYEDICVDHDGSRYARLDNLIRYKEQGNIEMFRQAAEDFIVNEQMIDILF